MDYFINVIDITNMLGKTNAGAELIIHDVFGAILYKGPGIFIAGGFELLHLFQYLEI